MGLNPLHISVPARWSIPTTLAGASLLPALPWRLVDDLFDPAATGIVIFQTQAGDPTIGLALAWLLIEYLIFRHTRYVIPDAYASVTTPPFRALLALSSLYFGIMLWGTLVPVAVPGDPFTLFSMGSRVGLGVFATGVGMLGWGMAFGIYFHRFHFEDTSSQENDLTAMMETYFFATVNADAIRRRRGKLPPRWQRLIEWTDVVSYALQPVFIALLLGFVGVVLNLFYPLPEVALFVGLVIGLVLPTDRVPHGPAEVPFHEIDVRLVNSISAATENIKGTELLLFTIIGMTLSAVVFFMVFLFTIALLGTGFLTAARESLGTMGFAELLLFIGTVITLIALFFSGPFSLVHWLKQLERIGPYARYWEATWKDGTDTASFGATVARPPGLLLPGHAPLVTVGLFGVLDPTEQYPPTIFEGGLFLCLAVGSLGAIVWGYFRMRDRQKRSEPQSLRHETRDLTLTLLSTIAVYLCVFAGNSEAVDLLEFQNVLLLSLLLALVLTILYSSDAEEWSKRFDGYWQLVGSLPVVVLCLCMLLMLELIQSTYVTGSTYASSTLRLLQVPILLLGLITVGTRAIGIYAEKLVTESQ